MGKQIYAKYGQELELEFPLYNPDGVDFKTDAVYEAGDVKIKKDGGAEVNTTNGFTDIGQDYTIVVEATELQAASITLIMVDLTVPKVWLDDNIEILTYGHPNAHIKGDFDNICTEPDCPSPGGDLTDSYLDLKKAELLEVRASITAVLKQQSYSLDDGQAKQGVVKASLKDLRLYQKDLEYEILILENSSTKSFYARPL